MILSRFADLVHLITDRTADPLATWTEHITRSESYLSDFHALRQGFIPPTRERSMSYLKPEHQERVADAYHAFKDVEGFAKVASLADIRANDGNLSIPLYVRGKAVSDEKGEYVADGLKEAVKMWDQFCKVECGSKYAA